MLRGHTRRKEGGGKENSEESPLKRWKGFAALCLANLAVKPGGGDSGDEELGAVRVLSGVGHGEEARGRVLEPEAPLLIGEAIAVAGEGKKKG